MRSAAAVLGGGIALAIAAATPLPAAPSAAPRLVVIADADSPLRAGDAPRRAEDVLRAVPGPGSVAPAGFPAELNGASRYVQDFARAFSFAVWRERYEQEVRLVRRFRSSGATFPTLADRRVLESELLLVWLPAEQQWIAVREVTAVDGKHRQAGPVAHIVTGTRVSVEQLKRLAAENGRFNIGSIVRTFSEPTLALLFLEPHYRERFVFRKAGDGTSGGRRAAIYEFREHVRPTVVRTGDRDLPVRGALWIEVGTNRVLQTSLEAGDAASGLHGRMDVRYGDDQKFDVLVPLEMTETYTSGSGERVTTRATYSDFRRFEASSRLLDVR